MGIASIFLLVLLGCSIAAVTGQQISKENSPCPPLVWNAGSDGDYYNFHGSVEFCKQVIDAAAGTYFYGYRDLSLQGSPCCSPGPTYVLTPGANYRVVLHNAADRATNLHTHGLHVCGSGNADNIMRSVDPGNCLVYNWTISEAHNGLSSLFLLLFFSLFTHSFFD